MGQLPDFGEGSPAKRRARRSALIWGALLVAVILALAVYAVVT